MYPHRPAVDQRILSAVNATPSRIPWLLGPSGSGRTSTLLQLRETLGETNCQYIDVERSATTPERFFAAINENSPFSTPSSTGSDTPSSAREAFDATLALFERPHGEARVTFLLDEVLEIRTFESFPGLRHTLRELVETLARSPNKFILTTRYIARAHRLLRDAASVFEMIAIPPMTPAEVRDGLPSSAEYRVPEELDELARAIQALSGGRPRYVKIIGDGMASLDDMASDPVGAMTSLLMPGGALSNACHMTYELRLHRARGYGALKAILDVLAREEPLTLTEVALRLHRTPGSTKDYLTWLEDVDLITVTQKRYSFTDPLLRLWVGLHCRPCPPSAEDVGVEVQNFALDRLPRSQPQTTSAASGTSSSDAVLPVANRKGWEIVEID